MAKTNKTPDVSLDASRKTTLKNSLQESRKISLGHLPFKTFLIDSLGGGRGEVETASLGRYGMRLETGKLTEILKVNFLRFKKQVSFQG